MNQHCSNCHRNLPSGALFLGGVCFDCRHPQRGYTPPTGPANPGPVRFRRRRRAYLLELVGAFGFGGVIGYMGTAREWGAAAMLFAMGLLVWLAISLLLDRLEELGRDKL